MRKLKKEIWPYQITINAINEGAIDEWCEKISEENLGIGTGIMVQILKRILHSKMKKHFLYLN